jgi:hypothetical protein
MSDPVTDPMSDGPHDPDLSRTEAVDAGSPDTAPSPGGPHRRTLTPAGVVQLQQSAGNAAMAGLLARGAGARRGTGARADSEAP